MERHACRMVQDASRIVCERLGVVLWDVMWVVWGVVGAA